MLRPLVCFAIILGIAELIKAGVFPNYRAEFDFIAWDNDGHRESVGKWWQTATLYQVYPRSFKDSNGDGIGDLNGISEKLPYLKEIGVTGIWISPIFTSPMADFGYDIANFTSIDPIFGTMSEFDALITRAKAFDIKVLLDFVPNHSSDECEWFKKSAAGDPEFKDFYIWHPGKIVDGVLQPPTNWVSVFRGSAWQWHKGRQEYYLHEFLSKQPDLNYRNPNVRETMKKVLRFWLHKGVDGFRVDAVPFLFEVKPDSNGNLPDEPRNEMVTDPDDYGYLKHIYTVNQPETIDMVYEWRTVLEDFRRDNGGDERILLIEAYSPLDVVMKFYGNASTEGAQVPFNFLMISELKNDSNAQTFSDTINEWLDNMPKGRTANWVIGNHDQNRIGSRLGADRIDMMNMLIMVLPGVAVTYYGEEIGMTDVWISWNDTVDPSACNSNPDIYESLSRDPERTPFQWSNKRNAGFSTANKTWLPISDTFDVVNVENESVTPLSHIKVYKKLQSIRHDPTMQNGAVEVKALNNNVLGIERYLLNHHTFIVLLNIFDEPQTVDLKKAFSNLPAELEYVVVTPMSKCKIGDLVNSDSVQLLGKEAVVLRSPTVLTTTAGYYTYYVQEKIH